ncbi:MAG: stage 0 sporulation family protein [Firmicutes bacterium]|nr:stage 0 sporulation family protein [Bacillota bacterium]
MPIVAGVKFAHTNKMYYFDPGAAAFAVGDGVVVETAKGTEFGYICMANADVAANRIVQPLKPILRAATEADYKQLERNEARKPDALRITQDKILKHNLDMKLVDAEYTFDGSKLVIYFTSAARVDFRDLVKDLAAVFHMRIELRQISVREECKKLGGLAPCGRECCCSAHLCDFERVSLKMAKNQALSLNPTKISGLCGKLMCCLSYENNHYKETARRMPKINSDVGTPDGSGVVVSNNFLKETVKVRVPSRDGFEHREYRLCDIKTKSSVAEDNDDDLAGAGGEDIRKLLDE